MRRLQKFLPTRFVREFLALEAAGGIIMIAAAALAIALANSPLSALYHHAIAAPVALGMTVESLTRDVLMALFFFTVGMELKLEMREGALAASGQKILPLIAALGGILVPALIYLGITHAHPELRAGWAIPTATDIAFALCVLRLIGPAIPQSAKIFLLAIAIYDDLAAIVIIALVYSSGVALVPLACVAAIILALWALNRLHVGRAAPYMALGIALWFALHHAGIHPTLAGVVTGMTIPLRTHHNTRNGFWQKSAMAWILRKSKCIRNTCFFEEAPRQADLKQKPVSPLLAPLLHRLHPYVAFGVLPLFAFASAGVDLRGIAVADMLSPLPMGIALALLLGKPIGIFAASFACVKLRIAALPAGTSWRTLYGIATIAGIGFTMSLFIGALAFPTAMQDAVRMGVIAGSLLSTVWGALVFSRLFVRKTA